MDIHVEQDQNITWMSSYYDRFNLKGFFYKSLQLFPGVDTHFPTVQQFPGPQTVGEWVKDQILQENTI